MAKQTINIGSTANDGTGSTLRVGGDLINDNFNEIYTAFGDGSLLSNAIPGKVEGANFTNSLLVGHSTTGALNAAEFNVGIGIEALDALTSGDKNTAIGNRAMTDANTGSENVALGALSLFDLTSGSYNVGIGMLTLRYVTNSQKNTAVGYRSHESGNGSNNTALGYKSGGGSSMTGAYNTSIGYQAGLTITSGDANLSIGNQAEPLSVTGDNQLTIGTYDGTTTTTWIRGDSNGQVKLVSGYIAEVALTDAATITWNAATQPVAKVTLGASRTMGLPANPVSGQFISLLIIQDGTGSRTITWNAAYEFALDTAPTLTATANLGDLFTFRYNGAKWLEVGRNLALTLS